MGFSIQFSVRLLNNDGEIKKEMKYPLGLKTFPYYDVSSGKMATTANGSDPGAVAALRLAKNQDNDIVITAAIAKKLIAQIKDNGRSLRQVAPFERAVYQAAMWAAQGKNVEATDYTGHWRPVTATSAGAHLLLTHLTGLKPY